MRRLRTAAATLAVAALGVVPSVAAGPAAQAAPHQGGTKQAALHTKATRIGTFSLAGAGAQPGTAGSALAPPHQPMNKTLRHTSASQVPNIAAAPVASGQLSGFGGFNGLTDYQQVNAGSGSYANSQFDLEPPDQALCVDPSADVVMESVNLALRFYSTSGQALSAPMALNQFFGQGPETTAGGAPFGNFLSDPKCYYDPATGGWFLSVLALDVDPSTGALTGDSQELIAATKGDPTMSTWSIYSIDTTDSTDPGCPCFGDQPLIGADSNGFYVTTNEYATLGSAYNGAQMYAMSKTALENGASNVPVVHLQPGMDQSVTNELGGVAFSIQPATSPSLGDFVTTAGGTEYFQSALDFGAAPALGTRADSIAVWSLTNTSSLDSSNPDVTLRAVVLPSEMYAQPPNAAQAPGQLVLNKTLPLLDANDDRMNQVVYAAGHLWSGLNTAVKTPQGPTLAGIAWFATTPMTSSSGALGATLAGQGYLDVNQQDVLFPSIGVNDSGTAVMAFTLAGPANHPSAAYAPLSLAAGAGPVYVASAGVAPEDGFTSLKAYGGSGSDRWGDYSAAVATTGGTIWMATEYIPGGARTPFANWGTFVYHVNP